MDIEHLREYCLNKKGTEESFPFDETTLVFKVAGKIFLIADITTQPLQFNVKCDPEKALELREQYTCVLPGYHMNKKHWNTIICEGQVGDKLLKQWIDDSYRLIVSGVSRKLREELQ